MGVHEKSLINLESRSITEPDQYIPARKVSHSVSQIATNENDQLDLSGIPLEKVEKISRYRADFIELEKIGQGGFGHVWKARHKLDGNIYAIKKVKLSKNNSDENKRIKREVTYLSGLNSPYIVRYFQTWVEIERDPVKIKEFCSDEYDDEYDEES